MPPRTARALRAASSLSPNHPVAQGQEPHAVQLRRGIVKQVSSAPTCASCNILLSLVLSWSRICTRSPSDRERRSVDFVAVVDQVIVLLRQRGRLTYWTLQLQFQLDEAHLEVPDELIYGQRVAVDEMAGSWPGLVMRVRVCHCLSASRHRSLTPLTSTPSHLTEKILTSRSALEGERKQVTVLFADLKGSMELLAERDPEEARQLLDPVLEYMMAAVHRYEGTVNQVMGDGIMALFGAPLAHEDHAVRACYAALAMQEVGSAMPREIRRTQGLVQMRVGLNSGEVVVRAIGNDLHMDYSAIGQTTHLAAREWNSCRPGQHSAHSCDTCGWWRG